MELITIVSAAGMKLYVSVLETRRLKHGKGADLIDACVKLKMGKREIRTGFVRGKTNPVWNEELVLRVDDLNEELAVILVIRSCGAGESEALGQAVVPVWTVAEAENQRLPPTWFPLQSLSTSTQAHSSGNKLQCYLASVQIVIFLICVGSSIIRA